MIVPHKTKEEQDKCEHYSHDNPNSLYVGGSFFWMCNMCGKISYFNKYLIDEKGKVNSSCVNRTDVV